MHDAQKKPDDKKRRDSYAGFYLQLECLVWLFCMCKSSLNPANCADTARSGNLERSFQNQQYKFVSNLHNRLYHHHSSFNVYVVLQIRSAQ